MNDNCAGAEEEFMPPFAKRDFPTPSTNFYDFQNWLAELIILF